MQRYKASDLQSAIIKTLAYSDLFSYPLTTPEILDYLIEERDRDRDRVRKTLSLMAKHNLIEGEGDFFFLKGREKTVELREKRERWSKEKLKIAQKTAKKLKIIPTIKLIGITGALAMNNCKEDDDIDLLIITSANTLWITRALIILLCPILGIKRRKKGEIKVKDKICFNLFLDENYLKVGPESLFLGHEVCQVKPIYDSGGIYEKFMKDNHWVKNFLPNTKNSSKFKVHSSKLERKHLMSQYLNILISFFDKLAFFIQYQYMKPKMTYEKVSRYQAFFHPKNIENKVLGKYKRLLSNIFDTKASNQL